MLCPSDCKALDKATQTHLVDTPPADLCKYRLSFLASCLHLGSLLTNCGIIFDKIETRVYHSRTMASYGITRLLWLYLGLLLAFGQVLNAIEDEVVPDADSLGIRLDYQLYQKNPILFSSRLEFTEEPQVSDRQMMTLGVDAYKEMEAMTAKYKFGAAKRPNTMTTMIVGKEIFFASSVKKGDSLKLGPGVEADLAACGTGTHRNQARCGEVMTFDAYYKANIGSEKLSNSEARIVAIMKLKRPGPNGEEYIIQPPCGDGDNWGCNRLVKDLNVLTDDKVAAVPDTTPFNWRQLKAAGKVAVTQSPTPADNESDPGASDPGQVKPPPKHPSQSKKPGTSNDEKGNDNPGDDEIEPPPKHPSQGKRPGTSHDEQGTGNPGDDEIEPPPKHPSSRPGRPARPPTQGDGEDHPGQGGDDDDNPSTGTKPKPKPKPKGNGRTRRHFYA
ncbi:hypothetical protein H634G_10288 [Metarhizium anisopliae BRIP 53293]|uniref:Uncharacterized protein n=1 Tax=Metarhizium anisopliae BRIP 53293 TaxID=1291518 RepID=A0A0D9NKG9_METAN|nr:hypothetical protein H634G_10288 [Metarhizium anisopliae BRIP 53293]KJK86924.1 hypothetical protein H633G_09231 [Metarhizium anisopliae BRIP 53284]